MITRTVAFPTLVALLGITSLGLGQQPPPVRQISQVTAVSRESLAAVTAAVEVAGGRLYVNDITGRRVLLYDTTLASPRVIADSAGAEGEAYGDRPGTLLPFRGDSALLITPASLSMLVLSPNGTVARVMAMPPGGGGMPALIGSIFGTPGFDAAGRLAFFAPVRMTFNFNRPPADGSMHLEPPDSALIVRFDFGARTLDTVAAIRIPRTRSRMTRDDHNRPRMSMTAIPPAMVDDWAVTSDGRIAVVRGRDYHVDWLAADGTWSSTPRMPYAWERLDDEQKTALIDSIATAMQAALDSMPIRMQQASGPGGAPSSTQSRGGPSPGGGGGAMISIVTVGPGGGPGGDRAAVERGGGGGPMTATTTNIMVPTVVKAELADVPDYRPPFRQGAVRADLEGNLWIRTNKVNDERPVYDIVNGRGELVDRVQLPPFRTIAGFGRGVLYMGVRDSTGVMRVERARVR